VPGPSPPISKTALALFRRKIGDNKRKADQPLTTIKAQIAAGTYHEAHREWITFNELVKRYFENPKNPLP